jgi:isoleucyl-tRNA synthetase
LTYRVVPNFRLLGPRLGGQLPAVKLALSTLDGAEVRSAMEQDHRFELEVDGILHVFSDEELEVRAEQHAELALVQDAGYAVALDLLLDDELRAEGFARELVRFINDQRKQSGFEIADRITTSLEIAPEAVGAATTHLAYINSETLTTHATLATLTDASDHSVAGHAVRVRMTVTPVATD